MEFQLQHILAALFCAMTFLSSGCQWNGRSAITGSVNLDPALVVKAQNPGAVLFVVARNQGDVPVAVKEIVTPEFPCPFTITKEDLILPGAWDDDLKITAQLATRMGADGLPIPEAGETVAVLVPSGDDATPLNLFIPAPKTVHTWATAKKPEPTDTSTR